MTFNSMGSTMRPREYYYMVMRHKIAFLIALILCLSVAIGLTYVLPKMYKAETILLVESEGILNPLISGLAISPSVSARMRTFKEELLSWQRLTLLVEKLGLDRNVNNALDYEKLVGNLRNHIAISMRGGELIGISYEGVSPKNAQQIVQTLADIIVQGNLTSGKIEANSAIVFIEEQMDLYRKKLEESEGKLREFEEVYNSTLPLATKMNEQLVQLKIDLGRMMVENTEYHPRVLQHRKLIQQIERQRDDQMKKARAAGFEIAPQQYSDLVTSIPRQRQHLEKLQRDYGVNERIYTSLLQRLETAKISQTLEQSDKGTKFRVLEPARLPLQPVKPNKTLIILGGVFIGLGLGAITVYFLELGNNSIRSLDEARELLELPILGAIITIRPEDLIEEEIFQEELRVSV